MNINGLEVDQDDIEEVRSFRQALLTRNQQQYPQGMPTYRISYDTPYRSII